MALKALVEITRALQNISLSGPLAEWDQIDSGHYITRLREIWPAQGVSVPSVACRSRGDVPQQA